MEIYQPKKSRLNSILSLNLVETSSFLPIVGSIEFIQLPASSNTVSHIEEKEIHF